MDEANKSSFYRIGQGFCGTVWSPSENTNTTFAIKREDGGPGRSLQNDYEMHLKVVRVLDASCSEVRVPRCHQYVSRDTSQPWWTNHMERFPQDFRIPCNALLTDRIPPFAKAVREAIIEKYCPQAAKESAKSWIPNRDCLIRPYLGRRRHLAKQSKISAFSLRNYPLHVDQMEELGLDTTKYARIMAETLAHLYWTAQIDANDIEFVLPPPRTDEARREGLDQHSCIESAVLGDHVVWVLDFDCCKTISMDEVGVQQAVAAFYKNDPFFPRPSQDLQQQRLWDEFKAQFLETSASILGPRSHVMQLPTLWIAGVEQRAELSSK